MACTVAVEESISEHYNSQIRTLMETDPERYTELLQVMCALIPVLCLHTYKKGLDILQMNWREQNQAKTLFGVCFGSSKLGW